MRLKLLVMLGALFVALAVMPAFAAEAILEQCVPDQQSPYNGDAGISQRFTPTLDVDITAVAFPLADDAGAACTGAPCSIYFHIATTNGTGQPISPPLWSSGAIDETAFPVDTVDYVNTDYTTWLKYPVTGLTLTSGVTYGLIRSKRLTSFSEFFFGSDQVGFGFSCNGEHGHVYSALSDSTTWTTSSWAPQTGSNSYPYVIWGTLAPIVLQATGVTSGEHEVRIEYDGNDVFLYVDNVLQDSSTSGVVEVANNTNDWEMLTNNAMPYVEAITGSLNSSLTLWYQFDTIPNLLLEDRSGNGNDTIARYPDTPLGVDTTLLPLVSTPDATVGTTGSTPSSDFVGGLTPLDGLTPGESANCPIVVVSIFDLPKKALCYAATVGNLPYGAMLVITAFLVTCAIGLIAYIAFRKGFIMYIAMMIGSMFAIFYGDGIWGWIVPITFAGLCAPFIVKELRT